MVNKYSGVMLFSLASGFNLIFTKPEATITLSCFEIIAVSPIIPSLEKIMSLLLTLLFSFSANFLETK